MRLNNSIVHVIILLLLCNNIINQKLPLNSGFFDSNNEFPVYHLFRKTVNMNHTLYDYFGADRKLL